MEEDEPAPSSLFLGLLSEIKDDLQEEIIPQPKSSGRKRDAVEAEIDAQPNFEKNPQKVYFHFCLTRKEATPRIGSD